MQRPTAVTVFGILNIVYAVFVLVEIISLHSTFLLRNASYDPTIRIVHEHPVLFWWKVFGLVIGPVFSVLLLVAGIALLKMKPFGRTISIFYSIAGLVSRIVGLVIIWICLIVPQMAETSKRYGPESADSFGETIGDCLSALLNANNSPEAAGAAVAFLGSGCCGFCWLVYPILLLIFMTRPNVIAAFKPPVPPPVA